MNQRCRQLTYDERVRRFALEFDVKSGPDGKLQVIVPDAWRKRFIVPIPLFTKDGKLHTVYVHLHAAPVFAEFVKLIDHLPETYDGGWVPRLKRGVKLPAAGSGNDAYGPLLSNHSRGTAIDMNARILPMGKPPTQAGYDGINTILDHANSIRVPMETNGKQWEAGLVWGGNWKGASCDPMHFELGTFEPARIST